MGTSAPSTNRRALVVGTVTGILAGGVWGAAIQRLARTSSPSLAVIGRKDAQITLLDTPRIRVLILLGEPDEDLQNQIPALLTMLRQRIDIVIGSASSVESLGQAFMKRWRVTRSLVFPEGANIGPDTSSRTWVIADMTADLGSGISLQLTSTMRDAWNAAATPHNLWQVLVTDGRTKVSLTPNASSAAILTPQGVTLLITPRVNPEEVLPLLHPAVIASNTRDDLELPTDTSRPVSLVRTYPQDISHFGLMDTGLQLPSWTERVVPG